MEQREVLTVHALSVLSCSYCVMIIRFVGIKMADFLWSVFNPSITNTATDFSYAFERDRVFMYWHCDIF